MNNIGQMELSAIGGIMGFIGAGIGWYMSGQMDAGWILRIMSAVTSGVACYFIGWRVSESG